MTIDMEKWGRWVEGGRKLAIAPPIRKTKLSAKAGERATPKSIAHSLGIVEKIAVPKNQNWPAETNRGQPDTRSLVNVQWLCTARFDPPIQTKFNEFDQRPYVIYPMVEGDDAKFEHRELDDAALREVMFRVHKAGLMVAKSTVEDALKRVAMQNKFHPVREYLGNLKWDGTPRLDKLLPRYAGADDTDLNRAFGRAWMVSAVRRIRQPGCKVDAILTLQSPQGTGKSTFFRILASDAWFNDSLEIGGTAKDVIENATGAWIIELAELSSLGKREVEEVKKFASIQADRARTAWARVASEVPRQFVFGATVNREEFLVDDTGNRRFWVVPVKRTLEVELARDRDQLWAEAAHLEAQGKPHNIAEELWPEAAKVAERHTLTDPIADGVLQELGRLPKEDVVVTADDIYRAIGVTDITRRSGQTGKSVATGARRAGWQSKLMRPPGTKTPGSVRCYHSARTDGRLRTYEFHASDGAWRPVIVRLM